MGTCCCSSGYCKSWGLTQLYLARLYSQSSSLGPYGAAVPSQPWIVPVLDHQDLAGHRGPYVDRFRSMIVLRVNQELPIARFHCLPAWPNRAARQWDAGVGTFTEVHLSEPGWQRLISPTLLPGLLRPGSVIHMNSHLFPRAILGGPSSVTSPVPGF